jgi:predicted nucleic acid-binding OB-fold protein
MDLNDLLHQQTNAIIEDAVKGMSRAHLRHYQEAGEAHLRQRLKALFVLSARAVKEKNLGPMVAHADVVARERFEAGYDLSEVLTAFNVLEEAIWTRVLAELPPSEYAEALGLISTVLGTGKDALACRYVTLASKVKATSLDLQSLFTGLGGL